MTQPRVEQATRNWEGKKIAAAPTLFQFAFPHLLGAHALFAPPPVEAMHAVTIMSLKAIGQLCRYCVDSGVTDQLGAL